LLPDTPPELVPTDFIDGAQSSGDRRWQVRIGRGNSNVVRDDGPKAELKAEPRNLLVGARTSQKGDLA
jgi:hypothetical protein